MSETTMWSKIKHKLAISIVVMWLIFYIMWAVVLLVAAPLIIIAALPFLFVKVVWDGIRRGYEA